MTMRVGVIGHRGYDGLSAMLHKLTAIAPSLGLTLAFADELLDLTDSTERLGGPETVDALFTFGGDGTFLRGATYLRGRQVPILGINLGRLGFLTTCSADEFEEGVRHFASGDYSWEARMMLEASALNRDGTERARWLSLNDVVMHKGGVARLVKFSVHVDGEPIASYSADGLIFSTPTGSTAYSLSAGGPIMVPTVESIVLTPISPHTLAMRPLVLPADSTLTVRADDGPGEILVTIDGQIGATFTGGESLVVRKAASQVRIVRFPGTTFFTRLRHKLGWGGLSGRDSDGNT